MLVLIIPTLNAEATLAATLKAVFAAEGPSLEVVIVDGGSTDNTCRIGRENGARVLTCAPGRGRQLAHGVDQTQAPWVLFLHADTRLPADWGRHVSRFIANPRHTQCAAYFKLSFDHASPGARRVATLANWRAQAWGLPYGDQGLLIARTLYTEMGGYQKELNIMEDVDLARRLGPMRLKALRATVSTSAAKYLKSGWWKHPMRNLMCLGLFLAGAPQSWIERRCR